MFVLFLVSIIDCEKSISLPLWRESSLTIKKRNELRETTTPMFIFLGRGGGRGYT